MSETIERLARANKMAETKDLQELVDELKTRVGIARELIDYYEESKLFVSSRKRLENLVLRMRAAIALHHEELPSQMTKLIDELERIVQGDS